MKIACKRLTLTTPLTEGLFILRQILFYYPPVLIHATMFFHADLQDHSTLSQICTKYLQPVYRGGKPRGGNVKALGERKRLHSAPRRPVIVKVTAR